MRLKSLALALFGTLVLVGCGEDEANKKVETERTTASTTGGPIDITEEEPAVVTEEEPAIVTEEETPVFWDKGDKTLSLYAWPDYFPPGVIRGFEKKTGIKVTYSTYQTANQLDRVLGKDPARYDIIFASTSQVEGARWRNKLQALDKKRLPNWSNLDQGQLKTVSAIDPENKYAVPFLWGTSGIGFEYVAVRATLGRKPPEKSWKMAFSLEYLELLGDCGVRLPNVADQVINAALIYLRKSPHTKKQADYDEVSKLFTAIKPYVHLKDAAPVNTLKSEQACVTIGWSPSLMALAQESSRAGRTDRFFKYVMPRSGTMLWFDMMITPKGAKHPGNAHTFMNYMMKADVAAQVTNYTGLSNANAEAMNLVDEMLSTDPLLYPPAKTMKYTYVPVTPNKDIRKMRAEAWKILAK